MEKIRAVIVDDEDHCRSSLKTQLGWSCPNVEVVGQAKTAAEGASLILKEDPDLVFLDIEMPGGSGFDMIRSLPFVHFKLVFTTAFDEYAVEAFKVNAIAYLMKPIDGDELEAIVDKIAVEKNDALGQKLESLMNYLSQSNRVQKIGLPVAEGLQFVIVDDIIRLEADGNYTTVYMRDKRAFLISKTLKFLSDKISDKKFMRVHQSHLINVDYIEKYIRGKNGQIIMDDGKSIPVSRSKKEDFLENWD